MQTQSMTVAETRAQIEVFKTHYAGLEKRLEKLTNDAALALVRGDDTSAVDTVRHQTAEDASRLKQLIASMELGLKLAEAEAAKLADLTKFERALAKLTEIKLQDMAVNLRINEIRPEWRALEKESKALDEAFMGQVRVREAFRDVLKKKHQMTDAEISQIEAKFKA